MLMFSPDRQHRWTFLALSMAITGLLFGGFYLDALPPKPKPQIIYVTSWRADRQDSTILRQQLKDLVTNEKRLVKRQGEYQRLADQLGIEWREDAATNKVKRDAMVAAMHKILEKRLATALAREAKEHYVPPPEPIVQLPPRLTNPDAGTNAGASAAPAPAPKAAAER